MSFSYKEKPNSEKAFVMSKVYSEMPFKLMQAEKLKPKEKTIYADDQKNYFLLLFLFILFLVFSEPSSLEM